MKRELLMKGLVKIISAFVLMCLLLFWPAGTWHYPGGWRLIGLLCIPMLIMGGFMLMKAPELLEKRLHSKEQEPQQKLVILLSSCIFILGFVLAGLDYRHGWTPLPFTVQLIGAVLFLFSYGMFAEVMRENAYLSRTVEIQDDQRVVDTGLYGIVRHPMYTVVMFLFVSMPLVLGSALAILPFLFIPAVLVFRIKNEETVLENGLKGYREYENKVRYRILPYIW